MLGEEFVVSQLVALLPVWCKTYCERRKLCWSLYKELSKMRKSLSKVNDDYSGLIDKQKVLSAITIERHPIFDNNKQKLYLLHEKLKNQVLECYSNIDLFLKNIHSYISIFERLEKMHVKYGVSRSNVGNVDLRMLRNFSSEFQELQIQYTDVVNTVLNSKKLLLPEIDNIKKCLKGVFRKKIFKNSIWSIFEP